MKLVGYKVVRLLGKGGMSEVYEVENLRLGSRHAVKIYAYPKEDADVRRRFDQEGRLLAKLDHPRVVRVTDLGETEDGRPYFVMDLVLNLEGRPQNLADIPDGGADEETIGKWYDDMREGLDYIHALGIVHRDLKLENVLIGPDGRAVLTDFGISRVFDPEDGRKMVVDTVQTLIGIRDGHKPVMGSLGYMAPELEMGVAATPQSDWYALGVVTYKLLTGTWCDARTDLRAMLDSYNPVWMNILPQLLHANPSARECLSFASEQATWQERQMVEMEERLLKAKARGRSARHMARYIFAGALVLGVCLGVGLGVARSGRQALQARLAWFENQPKTIPFDTLIQIPSGARAEAKEDVNGDLVMPSREQFILARDDAYVLLRSFFAGLQAGTLTLEEAIARLERMSETLNDETDNSLFDTVQFGGGPYVQIGENRPLQILLEGAIERLRELAEK